uniref:Large ribosomal subunit protein bL12 oligomerization domain-containing protein n=1 Tax=Ananas comosus var. bracteatus TaxID=296719 RepID=A0A6V7NZ60_ANACO|nr:unnamed protein product [Ananas comosus var. bracteatus]
MYRAICHPLLPIYHPHTPKLLKPPTLSPYLIPLLLTLPLSNPSEEKKKKKKKKKKRRKSNNGDDALLRPLSLHLLLRPPSPSTPATPSSLSFRPQTLNFPSHCRLRRSSAASAAAVSPKIEELGDAIANLTLAEARGLVDLLQDRLGVSAAAFAPAAVAAAPGAAADAAAAAPAVEEKTEFDVVIEEVPATRGSPPLRSSGRLRTSRSRRLRTSSRACRRSSRRPCQRRRRRRRRSSSRRSGRRSPSFELRDEVRRRGREPMFRFNTFTLQFRYNFVPTMR